TSNSETLPISTNSGRICLNVACERDDFSASSLSVQVFESLFSAARIIFWLCWRRRVCQFVFMGASGFYAGSESEIIAKTKPIPAENVAQPYISQPTL